ncbi:ABC transporter ATP-binding protein [Sulfurimonas sp. SAG-AH-194-L11]|nr:ABC transporter ATP-binding protein [Sulfurimonas sp. SAG-AH-194-L11]MDF1876954.1 ABC transporter ATP-binding protein [Sulfurimonas sp. SAG-AH-194-L11]
MIQLRALSKSFKGVKVVDGLSLDIKKGEIFGLLGPNAAGKTTTIRMLCSLLEISSGSATIAGYDLSKNSDALKRTIGYVAQYFGLYKSLSVYENLEFYSSLYGDVEKQKLLELLKKYQIIDFKDTKAGSLSGGYKRRLSLCCALVHNPEVIFLDEPTAGIDPSTRKALWDIFYSLSQEGKTLFVTTHYMEEAQRCHKIAFLNHGKKVIEGTPSEVENSLSEFCIYSTRQKFDYKLLHVLHTTSGVHLVNQFGEELRVVIKKELTKVKLEELMQAYIQENIELKEVKANLEDVFIALTQDNS